MSLAAGAGAVSTAVQGPSWVLDIYYAAQGIKVLTETQQAMCNIQTSANAQGNHSLSYYAGLGCKW